MEEYIYNSISENQSLLVLDLAQNFLSSFFLFLLTIQNKIKICFNVILSKIKKITQACILDKYYQTISKEERRNEMILFGYIDYEMKFS